MSKLLTSTVLDHRLAQLPGWTLVGDAIRKTYGCKNFVAAIGLVNAIGVCAEKADHHPDLFVHGWNKVDVILTTHSERGITEKDILLAHEIEGLGF